MTSPSSPSLEHELLNTLRQAEEPLTADQILARLPAAALAGERDPRRKVRTLLTRPQVGHAARGLYVHLPSRITGSTLRLPITGREAEEGWLWPGPELVSALWFSEIEWEQIRPGTWATCELPDGARSRITVEQMARSRRASFGSVPLVAAGQALREWLRTEQAAAGDWLLVRIVDAERELCRVELERLSQRDRERIAGRNRAIADAAAQVLRDGVRGKSLSGTDLAGWLLAREAYRDPCPPDPLSLVLLRDPRFTTTYRGHFALATKWEWVGGRNEALPPELLEAIQAGLSERKEILESTPGLTETQRRAMLGVDPIEELKPWLEAVGYGTGEGEENPAPEEELPEGKQVVYRFRAALKHRPSVQRGIEARGDNTLSALDSTLRQAFRHDTSDHMSGFFVNAGAGRKREELASFNPFSGVEEGEDLELIELGLQPGDTLSYVYDFGDWIEHIIQVEAVLAPQPSATYPRVVRLAAPAAKKRRR